MQSLEDQVAALTARVQALENATGLSRPTSTTEIGEADFFQLAKIDGMWLMERARMEKRSMEEQAIAEAIQKGAIAGGRHLGGGRYEITQFVA